MASPPHFVVRIGLNPRRLDPFFHIPEITCIDSINRQDYPHWTILLTGDGLSDGEYARARSMMERSSVPREKWVLTNMPAGDAERHNMHIYTNQYFVWFSGGTAASNHGMDLLDNVREKGGLTTEAANLGVTRAEANRLLLGTHMCNLDSDDIWFPNHLTLFAEAYQRLPNVSFAFSQSFLYPKGRYPPPKYTQKLPKAGVIERTKQLDGDIGPVFFRWTRPVPCWTVYSSVSWAINSPAHGVRARSILEQYTADRANKMSLKSRSFLPFPRCFYWDTGVKHGYFATDADFYDRVSDLVISEQIASVVVENVTVYHTYTGYKKIAYSMLRQMYCAPGERTATHLWSKSFWRNSNTSRQIVAGRRERLKQLFWPHAVDRFPHPLGKPWDPANPHSGLWRVAGRILNHADYLPSLESYRNLATWMMFAPPPNVTNGERGESLHIIRPLLDIACHGRESCTYVEVGDYCGHSLALALSFPRLTRAVQIGYHPVASRRCVDLMATDEVRHPIDKMEAMEMADPRRARSIELPLEKRCGHENCRRSYSIVREMEGRLRCVNATPHPRTPEMNAPGANPFSPNPGVHYLDEPEPVFPPSPPSGYGNRKSSKRYWSDETSEALFNQTNATVQNLSLILGEEKVDVLLLSKRDGLDDVQAEGAHLNSVLERYAPFVRVGGMIVLDSYLISPGVARVLERDGEYQMVKTGLSVRSTTDPIGRRRSPDHGQYAQMCSSQGKHGGFYCPGPITNRAQALSGPGETQAINGSSKPRRTSLISEYNPAFIMMRISAPRAKKPQKAKGVSAER